MPNSIEPGLLLLTLILRNMKRDFLPFFISTKPLKTIHKGCVLMLTLCFGIFLAFGDVTEKVFFYPDCTSNVLSQGCSFTKMIEPGDPTPEGLCQGNLRLSSHGPGQSTLRMFCYQGIRYFVILTADKDTVSRVITEDPKFKTPEGFSMKTRASTFKERHRMQTTGVCCDQYLVNLPSGWTAFLDKKDGEIVLLGFEKSHQD